MKLIAILAFAAAALAQNQGDGPTGGISGTVVDAISHQPIHRAMVNVMIVSNPRNGGRTLAASTDASGAFHIDGVDAGKWIVTASHQNYPSPGPQAQKTVEVTAGETTGSVTLELLPAASVSGQVTDEDGDPMQGCFVVAHLVAHPNQQRGGAPTDEDGQFHIGNLPAGKYLVSAQCRQPVFTPRPFSAGPNPPPSHAYQPQFYPLAPDSKSAQAVTLTAGTEKPGVDFRMRPAPVTQIHGTFASNAPLPQALMVQLISPGDAFFPANVQIDHEKRTFEFPQVFPGSYTLMALANVPSDQSGGGVFKRVDVRDHPLDLVLELTPPVDVTGTITVENDNPSNPVTLNQIYIQLFSDLPGLGQHQAEMKDDGTFTIKSVLGTEWRLTVNSPVVFLKSAWLGSTDITNTAFDLPAAPEPLRLVLGTNLGSITGTAPAGQSVYLISDESRFGGAQISQTDPSGRFTFSHVHPGTYRIGITAPNTGIPDEGGQQVTVHEGETVTVEVEPDTQPQ